MEISKDILFIQSTHQTFTEVINQLKPDKVAFLVDENTSRDCLPHFDVNDQLVIRIKSGEINKNIRTCEQIWKALTEAGFSRKSLLINLGGGVIGDMGGFTASTYKRGIRFINFPTTLLAMVDANIGGKLGIDFMGFKNHIGLFNDPARILVYVDFLKTLPPRELRSGFAEVIKHGLIYDASYWNEIRNSQFPNLEWQEVIKRSVQIKSEVVEEDPKENGLRKILNFGHTLGHGIETWYLNHDKSLLHGEAIATGMILEAHLSMQLELLNEQSVDEIARYITSIYEHTDIPPINDLMVLMGQDKKNIGNEINFSLLEKIGKCVYDMKVDENMIAAAINFYNTLK